ncbi:kinase-like domain-containing protein [Paraphoma chrysanthemicola]|uniref:Kinase-like domain-containing protein n=1 Tax=Paraphoma chrysanthemicola TaxID=798071 RepID=A0A8K0QZX3_9PLEO|nr:kinase-like domain-containing protein [Paraphoma chrysanthemicola]
MTSDSDASQALSAWNLRFGDRQIKLGRDDPEPFKARRRLGGGGIGIVHETRLDDIPLALKRSYARRLTDQQLNEIKILGRISEERHHHIVELVGSYIHRQRSGYELGLLIWPVAHCDLAAFLQDLDTLQTYLDDGLSNFDEADLSSTLASMRILLNMEPQPLSLGNIGLVIANAQYRTMESMGCIAAAVAYLHSKKIRHKDLKPSQILLSPHGLWLTDFGWSRDMSEYTHSGTSDGDSMTKRYESPERARKETCRESEDIFALGCIFAEMSQYWILYWLCPPPLSCPWSQKGWSFQENLEAVHEFFEYKVNPCLKDLHGPLVTRMIKEMLVSEPKRRPSMDDVIETLSECGVFRQCCSARFAGPR